MDTKKLKSDDQDNFFEHCLLNNTVKKTEVFTCPKCGTKYGRVKESKGCVKCGRKV